MLPALARLCPGSSLSIALRSIPSTPDVLHDPLEQSAIVPVPLENAGIELVEGYSTPGKLVEIEVTAKR